MCRCVGLGSTRILLRQSHQTHGLKGPTAYPTRPDGYTIEPTATKEFVLGPLQKGNVLLDSRCCPRRPFVDIRHIYINDINYISYVLHIHIYTILYIIHIYIYIYIYILCIYILPNTVSYSKKSPYTYTLHIDMIILMTHMICMHTYILLYNYNPNIHAHMYAIQSSRDDDTEIII